MVAQSSKRKGKQTGSESQMSLQQMASKGKMVACTKKGGFRRKNHNSWLQKAKANTFSSISKVVIDYIFRHCPLIKLARLGVPRSRCLSKKRVDQKHMLLTHTLTKSYVFVYCHLTPTFL